MTAWTNRIVGHGAETPDQLLANPKNWRIHPKAQQDALAGALNEIGFVRSVTVNRTTGFVVDGHLRVAMAISSGQKEIPVEYVELTPDEEAIALLSLDPLAALAGTDKEKMAELFAEINVTEAGLAKALADLKKSAGIIDPSEVDAEPQIDRAEELQKEWGTELGQVWQCGKHRVMCGDSTSAEDVARLLDGNVPTLMVTDPPYGVEYDAMWREAAGLSDVARGRKVTGDETADWTQAWALFTGAVVYCWHADRWASTVQTSLESQGFEIRNQVIWAKPHFPISRGHYTWKHEPCWYAVKKGQPASWVGDFKQSTLWEIALDKNVEGGHSTQKPTECMERPIRNHEGDVYDPFVGSGTTVIAAERQKRTCYAMDIDPAYVAVTLQRFKDATGIAPTLSTL